MRPHVAWPGPASFLTTQRRKQKSYFCVWLMGAMYGSPNTVLYLLMHTYYARLHEIRVVHGLPCSNPNARLSTNVLSDGPTHFYSRLHSISLKCSTHLNLMSLCCTHYCCALSAVPWTKPLNHIVPALCAYRYSCACSRCYSLTAYCGYNARFVSV